jgi:HemY protein
VNRSFFTLLLVLVVAAYVGALIARDPGYVLVSYANYSMQTSLWVMLCLLFFLVGIVYLTLRFMGLVREAPKIYLGWRGLRKARRSNELSCKGHRLLAEGEFQRALKFLDSGAEHNDSKAVNYMAAARAADHLGDSVARENYLRQALEADAQYSKAVKVLAAELAVARGEPDTALLLLKNMKLTEYTLRIKRQAIEAASDWSAALAAVPEIRQLDDSTALIMEKTAAEKGFAGANLSDDARHELFRQLSSKLKLDPVVIALYVEGLSNKEGAEPVLRAALKRSWSPELVALYGELGDANLDIRLKNAESWRKNHSTDAVLQYCLGRIYEQSGESSLARESYARSTDLGGPIEAKIRLADLMFEVGQVERSLALYREALNSGLNSS